MWGEKANDMQTQVAYMDPLSPTQPMDGRPLELIPGPMSVTEHGPGHTGETPPRKQQRLDGYEEETMDGDDQTKADPLGR